MKEKTKAFYKAVFKYWLHERKESVKRLFVRRTKRTDGRKRNSLKGVLVLTHRVAYQ